MNKYREQEKAKARTRRARVLRLVEQGKTMREIGVIMGFSAARASEMAIQARKDNATC